MKPRNRNTRSSQRTLGRMQRSVRRWYKNGALNGTPHTDNEREIMLAQYQERERDADYVT